MSESVIKLLLVEDNHSLARLLETMLGRVRSPRFQCCLAGSIAEATQLLPTGDFEAILLDLELPDSNGLGSLDRISGLRPDLPVIVLTAREEEGMALRALREGAQDYLIKGAVDRRHLVKALLYSIERKRGEEARSRLAAIVNSSQDAIIGITLDGRIVSWNNGAQQSFGYASDEVVGQSIEILNPASEKEVLSPLIPLLVRGQYIKEFEARQLRKNKEVFHATISFSPIHNSAGKIIGASIIARDIEDRKRTEREREELIHKLQAALAEIKALHGLLPICACCKKIRDDEGYWTQVEVYIRDHTNAKFTHGICPDCAEQYKRSILSHI